MNISLLSLMPILENLDEANPKKQRSAIAPTMSRANASKELAAAFKSTSVSQFVNKFRQIASDPKVQAVLKAGLTDGKPDDEKLNYSEGTIAIKGLLPTQSEIGFDQSIANILTDEYGSLKSILDGQANVGGPIVTYNGRYIIDGHHRWSQIFAANPSATVANIDIKGKLKPTDILKIVHAAIAAKVGGVPSANPKGINILDGITMKQVQEKVDQKLTEKAAKIWSEHGESTKDEIAKLIFRHLQLLIRKNKPIPGAPGRVDMPQTDVGGKQIEKINALKKGVINFREPSQKDVHSSEEDQVQEFKRRASISK